MKNKKLQDKILAIFLAFLMVFVNLPIISVYSDDSIKDMRTYTNVMDYVQATSDLLEDYPCDLQQVMNIDVECNTVTNANGDVYEAYDETILAALNEEIIEAEELLINEGYEVIDVSKDTISVEDPYQTKRIIIEAENLTTGNGAEKIIHFGNEYILQFATIQDTIFAYHEFLHDPTLDSVYLDSVVTLDEKSIEDFYEVNPNELVNGVNKHYSWGVTTMGLDVMQLNLLQESYDLEEVIVAVLDSGVNYTNKYLENRILLGYNFVDNNEEVMDNFGHGTHVAGIVCDGTANNVKILPVKVLNDSGKGSLLYVRSGIYYAIENGADVVNLSLSAEDTSRTVTYLDSVLQYAIDNNCVVCSSAGNDQGDVADYYPSRSDKVFTVGALDTNMNVAYYSNTGEEIDFCVPGSSIISTYKNGLAYKSGTSMSTPHVTAAVALLRTWNKNLTVSEIKQLLIDNCIDKGTEGKDNIYGYGCINLANFNTARTCKHEYVSNVTKTATCLEQGLLTYSCKYCNDSYTEETAALGHDYKVKVTPPTCIVDGYTTSTCSRCSDSFQSDIIKATGHNYTSKVTLEATCEKDGITTFTCSGCNDSYEEPILATGHTYQSEITKEPTHSEKGTRTYTCSKCSNSYTEEIPMEEHTFNKTTVNATCLEQGYDLYACTDCEYSYKDNYTEALGHDYQLFEHKDSTCLEDGHDIQKCSRCSDTITTSINKKGHSYDITEVIKPNCTEQGYTTYTCKNEGCKNSYNGDYVSALGHNYIDTVTPETCEKDGFTTHTCDRCNDSYVDTIVKSKGHNYEIVTTPATCSAEGSIVYTCTYCNDTFTNIIPKLNHSYSKITIEPTCEEAGKVYHLCEVCGHEYLESNTPAIGHNYIDRIVPPTCIEKGYTIHTCENCGKSYEDNITEIIKHSYNIVDQKEPTCTEDGYIIYDCNTCDDSYTVPTKSKGHDYIAKTISSTCEDKGYTLYKCNVCGHEEKDNFINALGHKYTAKVTQKPSCGVEGVETFTCETCGNTYTESITALTHNYKAKVVAPTCKAGGYTLYTCENCQDSYKGNYTNKLAHEYEGKITKQPTHTEEGVTTYTCKNCGDSYTETIKKADHTFEVKVISPTCNSRGYTQYTCTDNNCKYSYKDNYVDALKHEYISSITKEAVCGIDGKLTFTCKYCGDSYAEVIPALTHNYTSEITLPTCTKEGYTEYTCTNCGDNYRDSITEVLPHSYFIEKTTEATCKEKGLIVYRCQDCINFYTEEIPMLSHNYVSKTINPTCTEQGYTLYTCSLCKDSYKDNIVDVIAHSETDWIIDFAATCEKDGSRHKECTVCRETTKSEIISAIGHNYKTEVIKPTNIKRGYNQHTCQNCGYVYKDNYTDCTNELVNTVYKAYNVVKNIFNALFR